MKKKKLKKIVVMKKDCNKKEEIKKYILKMVVIMEKDCYKKGKIKKDCDNGKRL